MDETLKPCPFCGGEADYHSEKGPTGEVYGWVGCNQCDAMSCHTDTRSMQPEETHPIDAWNTRADAAPTPKADEVEAVARALAKANRIEICDSAQYAYSSFREPALAAIAALDAARGDPVARVVEWLRNGGGTDISQLSGSTQMLFLKGMNRYADAIERGEPFNG